MRVETATFLKYMSGRDLKELQEPVTIMLSQNEEGQHVNQPIVVIVPYKQFMEMQQTYLDAKEQIEDTIEAHEKTFGKKLDRNN